MGGGRTSLDSKEATVASGRQTLLADHQRELAGNLPSGALGKATHGEVPRRRQPTVKLPEWALG